MRHKTLEAVQEEIAMGALLKLIDLKTYNGSAPKEIIENPEIVGQVIHDIVGGCAVYLAPCRQRDSDVRF